ncbi:MAG: ammonium transporter [Planctomycetes bacterium]|nr:ammonium transporter [Planctomycetota bacterium]
MILVSAAVTSTTDVRGQEKKEEKKEEGEKKATPVAAEAPPPAAAAPAAAPEAAPAAAATAAGTPTVAPYISATSPDPSKPLWPDPTGANAGAGVTPSPAEGDIPSKMTPEDLHSRITHNMFSINMVWVLIAGFLVMFMQAGFMMVETGLCRAKNSSHTSAMNLMIYPLGCLAFWVYGFGIGWGNWYNAPAAPTGWYASLGPGLSILNEGKGIGGEPNHPKFGLIGTKGFFLWGMDDVSVMALFFFMMVFMDTTATIPTGSMAERWSWKNFCLFGLWIALPYCLYGNWVWGGGWLSQAGLNWNLGHGAVDFAGSGVVHSMGGVIALVGAILIGPRIGKYVNGKPVALAGHNIPMVVVGTFILAFGWFGFNPGSTLSGIDLRISVVVVNTMLAGVVGSLATMVTLMAMKLKPDTSMLCNGMLAGLVAVTAPCAFIDSWAAALIGGIAGVVVVFSVFFWDRLGIDDPVGAISVHGVNGIWGVLSLGLFANGKYGAGWNGVVRDEWVKKAGSDGVRGLFYGDSSQFMAQALSAVTVLVFGFVVSFIMFKITNLITPIRVTKEVELEGLDGPEMGCLGYPDFQLAGEN